MVGRSAAIPEAEAPRTRLRDAGTVEGVVKGSGCLDISKYIRTEHTCRTSKVTEMVSDHTRNNVP